mgnify:CR=1 FL=1
MNNDDLLEYPEICPVIADSIEKYCPKDQYSGQWERLRPQILDLVRKAALATTGEATELFEYKPAGTNLSSKTLR